MNSILNIEYIMLRIENANELLEKNALAIIYDLKIWVWISFYEQERLGILVSLRNLKTWQSLDCCMYVIFVNTIYHELFYKVIMQSATSVPVYSSLCDYYHKFV
jgi:hypothetical protein